MKHVGTVALALIAATAAAVQPAAASDASLSDGFADRATRFFEEARRRDCDGRTHDPARRACVDAALAVVYPAESSDLPPVDQADPGVVAHAYLSRSRVHTAQPEVMPDGTTKVEGVVGGDRCTVHLARAAGESVVWRVTALACK